MILCAGAGAGVGRGCTGQIGEVGERGKGGRESGDEGKENNQRIYNTRSRHDTRNVLDENPTHRSYIRTMMVQECRGLEQTTHNTQHTAYCIARRFRNHIAVCAHL